MSLKLHELLENISCRLQGYADDEALAREVDRIVADTEEIGEYCLFACIRTALADGHYSASAAYGGGCRIFLAERGLALPADATVILVESSNATATLLASRLAGHPTRRMTVLGVAGSCGKSSVAYLLHDLLRGAGKSVATLTSEGILRDTVLVPHGNILPDGAKMQRIFADFAREGVEFLVLEISSYMARQGCFAGIDFAAIALSDTDLKQEYLCALQRLAAGLPFAVLPKAGTGLLSAERVICFGEGGELFAADTQPFAGKRGFCTRFLLVHRDEKADVSLHVPGDFAITDALAATALAEIAGLDLPEIAALLSTARIRGTLECVYALSGRHIYRDAAYQPEHLSRVLRVLRERTVGKLTVVVGSVGGRTHHRRAPLGRVAAELSDLVYLTADNPDNESPQRICEDMTAEIAEPWRYVILPDRAAAIRRAVLEMRPGDTLLVAGKAREETQLVASRRQPFDEVAIISESARSF